MKGHNYWYYRVRVYCTFCRAGVMLENISIRSLHHQPFSIIIVLHLILFQNLQLQQVKPGLSDTQF